MANSTRLRVQYRTYVRCRAQNLLFVLALSTRYHPGSYNLLSRILIYDDSADS
jgi:hypothetical protein